MSSQESLFTEIEKFLREGKTSHAEEKLIDSRYIAEKQANLAAIVRSHGNKDIIDPYTSIKEDGGIAILTNEDPYYQNGGFDFLSFVTFPDAEKNVLAMQNSVLTPYMFIIGGVRVGDHRENHYYFFAPEGSLSENSYAKVISRPTPDGDVEFVPEIIKSQQESGPYIVDDFKKINVFFGGLEGILVDSK